MVGCDYSYWFVIGCDCGLRWIYDLGFGCYLQFCVLLAVWGLLMVCFALFEIWFLVCGDGICCLSDCVCVAVEVGFWLVFVDCLLVYRFLVG